MKVRPWSFTALDTFVSCNKQFHETRVLKRFPFKDTPETIEGKRVHKAFEYRQSLREPLPDDLKQHESFMLQLEDKPGITCFTERQVALDRNLKPCAYFGPGDVWWRGVIDWYKVDGATACAVDYKTGKKREKWRQLALTAIHIFYSYPEVNLVNSQYYWTQDQSVSRKIYGRDEIPMLWHEMLDDLNDYKRAFKTDTWIAKPSGLCHGWCEVTDCEHWKPKKVKS